ncbi:hypothetical protein GQ457_12G007470 [Hibiscus cannabinus]
MSAPISAIKDKDKAQDVSLFPLYEKKEEIKEIYIKNHETPAGPFVFSIGGFWGLFVCFFFDRHGRRRIAALTSQSASPATRGRNLKVLESLDF